jgi:serine/threonine protein kinase
MLRETDLLNEELEGYRITAELDSHHDNHIFLGDSISPNTPCQRVIVKLLNTTHSDILLEQQPILDTVSSLQQLHHPHILPIQSVGIYKDMPYLISEYIASGSLQDRLQDSYSGHPMPLKEALPILTEIGQALHYAHQQHIVHGNLKPQNVLLTVQNDVLLTDFHVHVFESPEKTDDTHPIERSTYWAPEQLSGSTSEKSDQYALACIAYELLTGFKAFMVPSVKSPGMYYKTKSLIAPGRFNPTLPSYIEEAILKAMSREPAQRYPDIKAFLYAMGLPSAGDDKNQPTEGFAFDLPVTPLPTVDTITLAKIALSLDPLTPEETSILADLDDPTLPALKIVTPTETQPSSPLAALDLPRLSPLKDNHPTLKTSLYAAINKPPFNQAWQKFTHLRQQHSLPLALLAAVIVLGSLFIGLNSLVPAKKLGATPYTSATTIAQFPPQTNPLTPITTLPFTSSSTPGIIPSSQGSLPHTTSTPNSAFLPTPTSALIPGATPTNTNSPDPTPTNTNSPDPTPSYSWQFS